jgi:AraC-like DNA-binding protein/copper chaperone CopZ
MTTGPTTFYVRGMVCTRCILLVERLVRRLGLTPAHVELGEVQVTEDTATVPWSAVADELTVLGFTLLQLPAQRLAQRLETLVTNLLRTAPQQVSADGGSRLAKLLGCRSAWLRAVSRTELGIELPQYLARRRVEAVQALLLGRPGVAIQDIARRLGYSSQAQLCRQFRAVAGCPPTVWRRQVAVVSLPSA